MALAARERSSELVLHVDHVEFVEHIECSLLDSTLLLAPAVRERSPHRLARLRLAGELHVVDHGHLRQHLGELERAHHASRSELVRANTRGVLAVERHPAGVGRVEVGEQVEECGLSSTIRTDQRGDGAALNLDMLDVDSTEAAERSAHLTRDEDGVGLGRPRNLRDTIEHPDRRIVPVALDGGRSATT